MIVGLIAVNLFHPVNQELKRQNKELVRQNRELLNRLQAPDAKTFQVLQNSLNPIPDTEYISHEDEVEAKRFQSLAGVGELHLLTDEDIKQYSINDFGLGLGEQ